MKKRYNIFVIILILAVCGCKSDKIDKSIVLKIGSLEITRYEFERNFNRELSESDRKNKKIVAEWKQEYIDRCLLTASGYDLGYDTINSLQEQINQFADVMMVQRYGYLWRYNISPIVDTAKIVTEKKVNNRSKLFYFDVIHCKNLDELLEAVEHDTILDNLAEFTSLKEKSRQYESISSYYNTFQWPFVIFWDYRDYLLTLKEGCISKLLCKQNDYYYIYIDYIESVDVTETDKNRLSKDLQYGTEKELDDQKTIEIEKHCKAEINRELIDTLKYAIESKSDIPNNISSLIMLKYYLKGEMKSVTLAEILKFINQLPFRPDKYNDEKLISLLKQYYSMDYLLYEADSLGLFKSDEFMLDRKNYQNNMVYSNYLNKEIYEKIKIDSSDISSYYAKNLADFSSPENVIVDIYVFENLQQAQKAIQIVKNHITNNPTDPLKEDQFVEGIQEIKSNVLISLTKDTQYTKEILDLLKKISVGEITKEPVKMDDYFLVFHKLNENGIAYEDFSSAKNRITNIIRKEKAQVKRQELLKEIRPKYPVEIDKTSI